MDSGVCRAAPDFAESAKKFRNIVQDTVDHVDNKVSENDTDRPN